MPKPILHTDKELVDGCIKNDRYAQEMLYRKFFATMMRMVMRYTKNQEEAMEILNNGFLRVFKKLPTYSFKGSLEGWIRKLIFHSVSDYFRSNSKPIYFMDLEDRDAPTNENALNNLYLEDVMQLVDLLPSATKDVFYLYAIDGYTHVEIADMLNISVGTSKWHLSNARKKLKQLIRTHYNHAG
ncbi:MAG: sigma-70 family RNA polymerase sigma factor [Chitinophagales bacterium]|nr:sigma-70 family RNA polymerase sigma factor [Chitinophagales bacterium]